MMLNARRLTLDALVSGFKVVIYAFLIYALYHSALVYLFGQWNMDDFSYCPLVPFIVLYLIWAKRARLAGTPSEPAWKGLIPLAMSIVLFWTGELAGEFTMLFFSIWLMLVALCWLHLGWDKLRIISFPLAFSGSMFVPPHALYDPLTLDLKLMSSRLAVHMLQLCGLAAYREGNVIDLGFTQLQVVDACSGLRYLIPMFLMGLLMVYYSRLKIWKRLFLVASTVPISIIANSLRIASVGVLYQFWGPVVAEGFFHDFSGRFIFMAGLFFLLAELWLLEKVFRERGPRNGQPGTGNLAQRVAQISRPEKAPHGPGSFVRPPQFIVAVIVLLSTVGLAGSVGFREKTTQAKPVSGIPLQVGEWSGARQEMEQQFLDVLKLTDYAMVDYHDHQGKHVSFYVAYNASQSKGEATHSPASCLPGSGWVFNESGSVVVPGAGKGAASITVSRAFMEKNGYKQLVYFWFPQRGRILTSIYQIKFYNFWDALTRHRTDGALVRVITPVYSSERLQDAENRLQSFTRVIVPVLDGYIPGKSLDQ